MVFDSKINPMLLLDVDRVSCEVFPETGDEKLNIGLQVLIYVVQA
jgi:hypothetical protein